MLAVVVAEVEVGHRLEERVVLAAVAMAETVGLVVGRRLVSPLRLTQAAEAEVLDTM